jgi:hypothetical protein
MAFGLRFSVKDSLTAPQNKNFCTWNPTKSCSRLGSSWVMRVMSDASDESMCGMRDNHIRCLLKMIYMRGSFVPVCLPHASNSKLTRKSDAQARFVSK